MIKGIAASNGIVIGKAFVVSDAQPELPRHEVPSEQRDRELERLNRAQAKTKEQLQEIRANLAAKTGEEEAAIFDAHLMLLEDPMLSEAVAEKIAQGNNAEAAVYDASETFAAMFDAMDDEYMRGRAADVRDVRTRWINNLLGIETGSLGNMTEPAVVFAHDLPPPIPPKWISPWSSLCH